MGLLFKLTIAIIIITLISCHVSTNWITKNICLMWDCCDDSPTNATEILLERLQTQVYGQPLITKPIYKSVKAHLNNEKPSRPLVMYFSGWTGTGKTHVARIIASSLYKKGMKSKYVKYISSSYHFPIKIEGPEEIAKQRIRLRDMIRDTVSNCERSLIILDELDKLPSGVVDCIQPLVDYIEDVDGVKYNKAIFIFLSNTGAEKLNTLSYKMYTDGKDRKDLVAKDIEGILIRESFNEAGGLRQSAILKRYSIGVFVPFLPLERSHVRRCIKDAINEQNAIADDEEKLIEEIADEMTYFPEDTQLYSKSGCKGVSDKVINFIGPPLDFSLPKESKTPDNDYDKTNLKTSKLSLKTEL